MLPWESGVTSSVNPAATINATIAVTSRLQRRILEAWLKDFDLSVTQAVVLGYLNFLAEHGINPQNQTELAENLMLRKTDVGAALEVLASRGAIIRDPAPDDRRSLLVRATARGRELAREVTRVMTARRAQVMAGISDEDIAVVARSLSQMQKNLDVIAETELTDL
jgi:MarR family transcriptional regulator, transcriptional regulator for hemolysin